MQLNKEKEMDTMETIINSYYMNNAKRLRTMVDRVLYKLKFTDVDKDDFYSLANEIFVKILDVYDLSKDFDGFLYSCLERKFKTEMTRRNRQKRQADKMSISWDTPIGDDEGASTLKDVVPDNKTIESEVFEEKEEGYSEKMTRYLGRLSNLQKEVLRLISIGFTPCEIIEDLHINKQMYQDCYNAIHSYRNVEVLL